MMRIGYLFCLLSLGSGSDCKSLFPAQTLFFWKVFFFSGFRGKGSIEVRQREKSNPFFSMGYFAELLWEILSKFS